MQKETMRNIREIATVTAVGAAEGAAIGFATGMGFLSLQGYAAGGIIGGLTALTTELIGRRKTVDMTIQYSVAHDQSLSHKESSVTNTVTLKNVPMIQDADKVLSAVVPDLFVAMKPVSTIRKVSLDVIESHTDKDGITHEDRNGFTITSPKRSSK